MTRNIPCRTALQDWIRWNIDIVEIQVMPLHEEKFEPQLISHLDLGFRVRFALFPSPPNLSLLLDKRLGSPTLLIGFT